MPAPMTWTKFTTSFIPAQDDTVKCLCACKDVLLCGTAPVGAASGKIYYSTDGIDSWSSIYNAGAGKSVLSLVTHSTGGTDYVYGLREDAVILRSASGLAGWAAVSTANLGGAVGTPSSEIKIYSYDGKIYCTCLGASGGNRYPLYSSTDGTTGTWTPEITSATAGQGIDIIEFGGDLYVACNQGVGGGVEIFKYDGSWSAASTITGDEVAIEFATIGGVLGLLTYSTSDPNNYHLYFLFFGVWTLLATIPADGSFTTYAGLFTVPTEEGDQLVIGSWDDGTDWTLATTYGGYQTVGFEPNTNQGMTPRCNARYNGYQFFGGGSTACVWYSDLWNRLNFTPTTTNFDPTKAYNLESAAIFNDELYVGSQGRGVEQTRIYKTTDCITFTDVAQLPDIRAIYKLLPAEVGGTPYLYAFVYDMANVYRSSDGSVFSLVSGDYLGGGFSNGIPTYVRDAVFFDGKFYAAAQGAGGSTPRNSCWSSTTGTGEWDLDFTTPVVNGGIGGQRLIIYQNNLYLFTGTNGVNAYVYVKTPGGSWDSGTALGHVFWQDLCIWNDKLYITTSNSLFEFDGATWTLVALPGTVTGPMFVSCDNRLLISHNNVGGTSVTYRRFWVTEDARNFEVVNYQQYSFGALNFPSAQTGTGIRYKNRTLMFGGTASGAGVQDARGWYSQDDLVSADFEGDVTSGSAPLSVNFTSLSQNANQFYWDFSDGNTSVLEDPSNVFNSAGSYDVILDVWGVPDDDQTKVTETKLNYITATSPVPVADFSGDVTSGDSPLSVNFTDLSTNTPTSWLWDFGDGDTSTLQNPSHIYTTAGAYTVTLTATNLSGSDVETKTDYITVNSVVAAFSGTPTSDDSPLLVSFTDSSTGTPTSWLWDFGDGDTSTSQNPSHTYITAGTYTVTLTATNVGSSDVETKTDYITVNSVVAAFSGAPTSGLASLLVSFTDSSTGTPTSWLWDFGDGDTSTLQNPSHTYVAGGTYTVALTATNAGSSDVETKINYIAVTDPAADFSGVPLSGTPTLSVSFTDSSNFGPTSWLWTFGDPASGALNTSTLQNPTHDYGQPGAYTVSLVAISGLTILSETKINFITVNYPVPVASFIAVPVAGYVPLTVDFTNSSTGFPVSYLWDFGDGHTSILENPQHTYVVDDVYTVTLTVTNPAGADTATTTITVLPVIEVVADFYASSMTAGTGTQIVVQYQDASINALSWEWDFGDPASGVFNTSTDQNPVHTYSTAGVYQVSLIARNGPFSDTTCRSILVTLDVLRYQEIWGTARFIDGTPMAANRVVAHQQVFTDHYDCPSDATDPFHAYKTINDAGVTRFLIRCRGHVAGIPNSGFEDGDPVYLSIGGRMATDQAGDPVSVPFYQTLPSNPQSHIELNLVFPLASSYAMPAGGTYEDDINVSLYTNVYPAIMWYTVDGSNPKTSPTRTQFTLPILITEGTTTLKFYSEDPLGPDELVKEEVYIINGPLVLTNIPAGEYSAPQEIELTGNREGTIYYQLNSVGPYQEYLTPITVDGGPDGVQITTIKAYLDADGDVGVITTFEYTIDLISPTIQSFTINNGDPITSTQLVTVQIEASCYTNTVTGLLLSVWPDFAGAIVQLYQSEVTFMLPPPDGVKTLYAKVFDQFSRASAIKTTSIILDTAVPVITVSSGPAVPIGNTSYTFTGTKSAESGILVTVNGGVEVLVVSIDDSTIWEYEVPLVEGTNTILFQGITQVGNRSSTVTRTVVVYTIPVGVTDATTITGLDGIWRIPFVFANEMTGEEATINDPVPGRQHHNTRLRQHDFRITIRSDSVTPPVITFPQADAVLTENVITVTGTAEPGSLISLHIEPKEKVPA